MRIRSAALATGMLVAAISVAAPTHSLASAQTTQGPPTTGVRAIRIGDDPRRVGLPAGARVRVALFDGLFLTDTQGKTIAALSEGFFKKRLTLFGNSLKPLTPADTAVNEAFIQHQFQAYRDVLSPSQRARFDANVSNIMTARARHFARRDRGR